jgi:hypothetical protein
MATERGNYQRGGGSYASERRIGYRALRRAGFSPEEARSLIDQGDAHFFIKSASDRVRLYKSMENDSNIPRQSRGLYGGNPSKGFGSRLVTRNRAAPFRPPLPANECRLRALFANRLLPLASGDAISTVVLSAGVLTRREPV